MLYHLSDPHLSFVLLEFKDGKMNATPDDPVYRWRSGSDLSPVVCKIAKRMDRRTWSLGLDNYAGYIERILEFSEQRLTDQDIVVITGDLGHDMSKSKVRYTLEFIDQKIKGIKVLCRGNHDWGWDFGALRALGITNSTFMVEEGTMQSVGPYLFGCWSEHRGKNGKDLTDGNQSTFELSQASILDFACRLADQARKLKKVPIFISHYPVPRQAAEDIGNAGIKAYLSGHVHCTNNRVAGGVDWSWYEKTAKQTDDQDINGCFFSTGTTDVLLKKHNVAMKSIQVQALPTRPRPERLVIPKHPTKSILILVGLPGSGKSTFADKHKDLYDVRISQDELGSKDACYQAMESALSRGQSILIDRTNISRGQRAGFVQLAKKYKAQGITAVWLDSPEDVCIQRVLDRTGHRTINDQVPPEKRRAIVEQFAKSLEIPSPVEGFDRVYRLSHSGGWNRILQVYSKIPSQGDFEQESLTGDPICGILESKEQGDGHDQG